ncbi:unnamed protein product [Peronospora belbahrii]|uniref:Protein kinase domain-containing protein n=1 Tax=Peronospora belbahrii TaxID=622444 RepID=A0ABN8DCG5_9STRA|nr:unnamed protein product [Peronospora belbahrii]
MLRPLDLSKDLRGKRSWQILGFRRCQIFVNRVRYSERTHATEQNPSVSDELPSRATDMYSFGMVLSDGAVPFSDTKFDFELIEECWAQDPIHRPSAPKAAEIFNTILDNMSKDSDDFATMASVSGSEYTNSIFSSLRNGDGTSDLDHRPSSILGPRVTSFFRGRFSVRSSSGS